MTEFADIIKTLILSGFATVVVVVLILSIPGNRLMRPFFALMSMGFFCLFGFAVLYICSPLDLLPDVIPIIGQIDDVAAFITTLFTLPMALITTAKALAGEVADATEPEQLPPPATRRLLKFDSGRDDLDSDEPKAG